WTCCRSNPCEPQPRVTPIGPFRPVKPTSRCVVISDFSVRASELEIIQEIEGAHEAFFVDIPANSAGRKESKTVALPKLFRTVIRTVVFKYIFLIVIVGGTEDPVFPGMRNLASRCILCAIEKPHLAKIMLLTQCKIIIELQLIVHPAIGSPVLNRTFISHP